MSTPSDRVPSLLQTIRASIALRKKDHDHGILQDIQKLGFKDYETLGLFLSTSAKGINDDNKYLVERLVQLLAKLPPQSEEVRQLSDGFIDQLWNALDHPPASSLGDKYQYRQADGSHNNISDPQLGSANKPYARLVRSTDFQDPDLPDPATIFDKLMARGDTFAPHPQGISSMLPYFATIIIHDIFQTSPTDHNINIANSYLDLSSLYGRNSTEVRKMRTFKYGLLKPDCFSSARLLGFPPGCGVLLIMFNRFHNYVVTQLALINESGRYTKPHDSDKDCWTRYDEDLFQTGRLVTCGLYINIVMVDYVRTILALNRVDTTWSLDPRAKEGKTIFSKGVPAGVGNVVSAEFNLLYRWHSTISPKDEKWAVANFNQIMKGKDPQTASTSDVLSALAAWQAAMPSEPEARKFSDLKRLPDGTFSDDDLVKILTESIDDNLGTLNEFREFMGLSRHATFEDINPDPEVAARLKQLYHTPDHVELYPGTVAEKTKPPMSPGSGLCGTVTMTTAILSDAVSLVRGDRFYTIDYTPKLLTNWGFNEVDGDKAIDGGHVIHKLIFRAFPNHFANNSVYAHFSLVTPTENGKILKGLGKASQYSWERPRRRYDLAIIRSYKTCTQVLNNQQDFKVTWGEAINFLSNKRDGPVLANEFCLAGDSSANASNRDHIYKCLYPHKWDHDIKTFFAITTDRLVTQYSHSVASQAGSHQPNSPQSTRTYELDIVRDVIALVATHFSAALCAVVETLKESLSPKVRVGSKDDAATQPEWPALRLYGRHMIKRMLNEPGNTVDEAIWGSILPASVAGCANQTEALSQAIDYYLGDGKKHLPTMYSLAHEGTEEAEEKLKKYFLEGVRLRSAVAVFRDLAADQDLTDFSPSLPNNSDHCGVDPLPNPKTNARSATYSLKAGSRLLLDLTAANHDSTAFHDPETVRLDRPLDSYIQFGWGPHLCVGRDMSIVGLSAAFKNIVGLKNLRRAPGGRGMIKSFTVARWNGQVGSARNAAVGWTGLRTYMTADQSAFWPIPSTLKVLWDE
ncbi:hypothetical protein SLS53_004991 [Cytospora paraplurivora]|uniref:linoleate 8R-lipoxygenase n=1 Tax=Cytospora paraplurivora TaxID=2898453 RepID=A0AAN9U6Z6_9PEZI